MMAIAVLAMLSLVLARHGKRELSN